MEMISSISICLQQRGIKLADFAREMGMTPANFGNVYAHKPAPRHSYTWERVCDKLRDKYHIDYHYKRGWYCMTDEEYAEDFKRRGIAMNRFLTASARAKAIPAKKQSM